MALSWNINNKLEDVKITALVTFSGVSNAVERQHKIGNKLASKARQL